MVIYKEVQNISASSSAGVKPTFLLHRFSGYKLYLDGPDGIATATGWTIG
jgi:hypothetical protein